MLSLNLLPVLKARGIDKPHSFLVKAGISPHSATSILNSETRSFRLDHIEIICSALLCEPNDLLSWSPEKGQPYSKNNPLSKLIPDNTENSFSETVSAIPYSELKEITKNILSKGRALDN